MKSLIVGGPGTYVPFPSHSFLTPIGPTAWLLMLDCRYVDLQLRTAWLPDVSLSEQNGNLCKYVARKNIKKSFKNSKHCQLGLSISLYKLVTALCLLLVLVTRLNVHIGVPIAYPRMVFLETALSSKFNPLVALGRSGYSGLRGFVNKFNDDAELLDDLVSTSKHLH